MRKQKILDKDGVALTPEEIKEYEDDIWALRTVDPNPVATRVASLRMWNKWGKRLGFPHPDEHQMS